MSPIILHIAILDCDTPVPNVFSKRGLYSDIFAALLKDVAAETSGLPALNLRFSKYDCVLGSLPTAQDLLRINAIIITGSSASAYDPAPWIESLTQLTRNIYTWHHSIKIFGSCFGHQVLCHALFSPPDQNIVSRDPAGWELGVQSIDLTNSFLSNFGPVTSNPRNPRQLRLQFVHADHVVLSQLPEGFESVGSSRHCILQGIWQKGRVLTFQGHAEFDRFINGETVKTFGGLIWDGNFMLHALKAVDADDDADWAGRVMLKFFLESGIEDAKAVVESANKVIGEDDVMARFCDSYITRGLSDLDNCRVVVD